MVIRDIDRDRAAALVGLKKMSGPDDLWSLDGGCLYHDCNA
jgi:hypothetical protein